jgi:hypothetical protein
MYGPDPMTALYLALEEAPGDRVTLLALADCYLEDGHADASACLRWTADRVRFPFRYAPGLLTVNSPTLHEGWYWWAIDDAHLAQDWGHPQSCRLPAGLWKRLRHEFNFTPAVFKHYPTIRAAYEALFDAWPLAPAQERSLTRREARR